MFVAEIAPMVVEGQLKTLLLSIVVIIICYMIAFRSFAAGLSALIPLIFAIIFAFGLMGLLGISLDLFTATLTGIMIGAGTDYTAYFLWRIRQMGQKHKDYEKAYEETMTTIGKVIIFYGFSVVVGFFVFLLSSFQPVIFFGFLIGISIFSCILSALTILPVYIFIVKPKFILRTENDSNDKLIGERILIKAKRSKIKYDIAKESVE